MEWTGVFAIVLSLALSIAGFVRSYGEDRGEARAWRKMIEDTLARHTQGIEHTRAAHQEHVSDDMVHWTEPERSMLAKQLDRIEGLIRELLMPRSANAVGRNNHASEKK